MTQSDPSRAALADIIALSPETEYNKDCGCTVCQMRRIAVAALREHLPGKPDCGALEQILTDAMGWHPSENGPSYTAAKDVLRKRILALPRAVDGGAAREALQLACEYEDGTAKAVASGYEEWNNPNFLRKRKMIVDALRQFAALAHPQTGDGGVAGEFQPRVLPWMLECFGPTIPFDKQERNHRFLEEALELVQACGCTQSEAHQLVDYVYDRDQGDINQEVGGVMVTLAALCIANGFDMHKAGETELARIWTKVEQIRAKQAAKPKHSPLPALPLDREAVGREGYVLIPQSALDWLDGSAPAPDGKWFSQDAPDPDEKPYRRYWWRSRFRELCGLTQSLPRSDGGAP